MLKFTVAILFVLVLFTDNGAQAQPPRGQPPRGQGMPQGRPQRPPQDRPQGGRGPGGRLPPRRPPRRNVTRVDLGCTNNSVDPVCPDDRNGDPGVWVCREKFDRLTRNMTTFSTCVSANRTLSIDECGCCGGDCPQLCTCPCDLSDGDGAGVTLVAQFRNRTVERCLPPHVAATVITRGGRRFSCDESCLN